MADTLSPAVRTLGRGIFVRARSFGLQNESNFFIQNLSVLVGSGMGVPAALASVREETSSLRLKSALDEIIRDVDEGLPLSKAIRKAGIVSPHTLSLIELGEMSGRLSDNLEVAAVQNEKEATFRSRVRSALAYSTFVFVLALVVGIGTAWFILPQIADFFEELHAPVPPLTQAIIGTGTFLQHYGFIFIPAFVFLLCVLFYFLFSFPKTRFIGHTILFHVPLIKTLIKETEIARFGFLTGTMIKAGMPLHTAFALLPETSTFGNYQAFYRYLGARILEGSSFQKAFAAYPHLNRIIPSAVRQMVVAAEQSGTLAETFLKVGSMYETKMDASSRNIPAFLEPALLLVIGGMVGILALGILMPIYQIGLYF